MGGWGAAAGAALGIGGGIGSAFLSAAEAKRQRKWQHKMRKQAYQDTMQDMRKAGLNPILAYKTGATQIGQGAVGHVPDLGQAAASGARAGTEARTREGKLGLEKEGLRAGIGLAGAQEAKATQERSESIARERKESAQALGQEQTNAIQKPLSDVFTKFPELKLLQEGLGSAKDAALIYRALRGFQLPSPKGDSWQLRRGIPQSLRGPGPKSKKALDDFIRGQKQ